MRAPQYNRAACLISGLMMLCLLATRAIAGELSASEYAAAASRASEIAWAGTKRSSVASTPSPHVLGVQTLSIEADWKKHTDGTRLARIYQYSHDFLTSRLLVLEVNTQRLVSEQRIDSVHLPLSNAEIAFAKTQLEANSSLLNRLNRVRAQRSLAPVGDLAGYDVKAIIYEPLDSDNTCAMQRCALFALVDPSLTVSSVEPLVIFSTGEVRLLQGTLRE